MSSQTEPLANLVFLKTFSKGNKETEQKYIAIFLRNTPDLMEVLEKQIKQKDLPAVEITAHSLKAQFNFIGFTEGESCTRRIRAMAQERKNQDEIQHAINLLRDLCDVVYVELKEKLRMPQ